MVASLAQVAKRALLARMRAVALTLAVVLTCNRDSSDQVVVSNFRKLALRAQPDRPGGSTAQQPVHRIRLSLMLGAVCAEKQKLKNKNFPVVHCVDPQL